MTPNHPVRNTTFDCRRTVGLFSMVVGVLLLGCTETQKMVPVSGTVLVDGEPLTMGTIRFVPEAGRPVSSAILEDGSFQLAVSSVGQQLPIDGIPLGSYRIAVSASEILNEEANSIHWHAPSHYADFRTSGLEANIDGSTENLLVELSWEGVEQSEDQSEAADGSTEQADIEADLESNDEDNEAIDGAIDEAIEEQ